MTGLLNKETPLYLPTGSVRSVIALLVVVGYMAGWFDELSLVTLVLGFYFGERAANGG